MWFLCLMDCFWYLDIFCHLFSIFSVQPARPRPSVGGHALYNHSILLQTRDPTLDLESGKVALRAVVCSGTPQGTRPTPLGEPHPLGGRGKTLVYVYAAPAALYCSSAWQGFLRTFCLMLRTTLALCILVSVTGEALENGRRNTFLQTGK